MEFIKELSVLEADHRHANITSKINLYFVDVTKTSRTPEQVLKLMRSNGIVFEANSVRLIGDKYTKKLVCSKGYLLDGEITAEILMRFIKTFRTSLGYSGTSNIVVLGGDDTWEEIKYWCNGAFVFGDTPPEGFVTLSDNLEGHIFVRRPYTKELNQYSILLNTIHHVTTIPESRSTVFSMTLNGFLVGMGTSSARPRVKFDRELGIKYAKNKALEDAKDNLGLISSFSETVNGWISPKTSSGFTLYNYADLTYKNTI